MIFSDASSSVLVRHLHAPEAVRAAASLRTYACSDGGRRAGQLWVSSAHVFFNAAGGSRVVIHIGRIRAIEMPRGWPVIPPRLPGGRRGRMLRFWLTPSGEGGKARREEFYGFTDRECVQRDILQQATAAGHTVAVIAGRLGCF